VLCVTEHVADDVFGDTVEDGPQRRRALPRQSYE
jgi:hypothetical protein